MTQMSTTTSKHRADLSYGDQIGYNQGATDNHGQTDGGSWRDDCSGMIDAIAGLPTGLGCPTTSELTANYVGAAFTDLSRVTPYRTVAMTTAADGTGHPFGHVALVIGYNASTNQLLIQEHGGGVGPDRRWLPSGMIYDSVARYGSYRPFKLYDLNAVAANPPAGSAGHLAPIAPRPPVSPGHGTPFPFPAGEYYGDIQGPAASHGGYYPKEKAGVAAIQRLVGVTPDGIFGRQTIAAVQHWQAAHHLGADGHVGPVTWKAMGL